MPLELPCHYKVAYTSSVAGEIHKNVQLEPDEEIFFWSSVQKRANWLWMQPGILQLTSHRLIILEHHAFSADWILEIPRFAIVNITNEVDSGKDWIAISYSSPAAVETVKLRPFALRGRPLPERSGVLLDALTKFHSGELTGEAAGAPAQAFDGL